MKFFIDTADIKEIRDLAETGLVDGVTTNPSLVHKSGERRGDRDRARQDGGRGPQARQARRQRLREGAADPGGAQGLQGAAQRGRHGQRDALLLAGAGAARGEGVSPFVGRLDDVGTDGMALIADIVQIYNAYPAIETEVLVASVRHPIHVVAAAKMGADVATLPPPVLRHMFNHPLTDKGLAAFLADWAKTGQSIL
jgi:transaldolase